MSTVVDPRLDQLNRYLEFSSAKGMKITNVIDTHIQADHVSGGAELARITGAHCSLHDSAETSFSFHALKEDEEIQCGNVVVRVLHTPGGRICEGDHERPSGKTAGNDENDPAESRTHLN